MKLRHAAPGLVWVAIGIAVYVYCQVTRTPLVIRGTTIPWSYAVVATGVLIAVFGMWRNRKEL
jgi:hypothetical protein